MTIQKTKKSLPAFMLILLAVTIFASITQLAKAVTIATSISMMQSPSPAIAGQKCAITFQISPAPPAGYVYQGIRYKITDPEGNGAAAGGGFSTDSSGKYTTNFYPHVAGNHRIEFSYDGQTLGSNYYAPAEKTDTIAVVFPFSYFIITISPTQRTQFAFPGQSVDYGISVLSVNGFSQSVSLSVQNLPSNVGSKTFNPSTVTPSGTSTLTIATNSNAPPGTYTFTVLGSANQLWYRYNLTLSVVAFSISATPSSRTINPGQSSTFSVLITSGGGFQGWSLSVKGLPTGATGTFNPSAINSPGGTSTLQITTSTTTPPGTYTITITGTGSGMQGTATNQTTVTLIIAVIPPLEVAVGSDKTSIKVGESATLTANVTGGTAPYSCQWYEGSSAVVGGTSTQLTVTKNATGSFSYYCRVTDSGARTATSNTVTLTVAESVSPLEVAVGSDKTSIKVGESATLTASVSGGTGHCTYQWYEGTTVMAGETSATLHINKGAAGTYTYYCKITDTTTGETKNTTAVAITVNPSEAEGTPLWIYLASAGGLGAAGAGAVVAFKMLKRPRKPPTPAQLRIIAEPLSIIADGDSRSTITLQLLDKKGKPISAIADTQVRISAASGKLENPVVTIPKGKDTEKTVIVSSKQSGQVPVVANAEGLRSISITLNFEERKRYCMHCGSMLAARVKACQNCGKTPPAGADTKICAHCNAVIPVVAKFCSECGAGQAA